VSVRGTALSAAALVWN